MDSEPEARPGPGGLWGPGARRRREEEPRVILGLPADWFERVDVEWFRSLVHPLRSFRRWSRRRRLGPYDLDDDADDAEES